MRRLAFLAAAVLAVSPRAGRAEPLDLDLSRLGPPDPTVWGNVLAAGNLGAASPATLSQLAQDSKARFANLSTQMALAMSSALLQPASTGGYTGFSVDLEAAFASVQFDPVGVSTAGFSSAVWPNGSTQPTQLTLPSVHVRKALPFSFEVGGRLMYLNESNYFAAQGEAKWALNEGFEYVPDLAVRFAYTRMLGVKDWDLSATDLDFLVSMRFSVLGVTAFTPYLAARFTYVNSSTSGIDFAPYRAAGSPVPASGTIAAFPGFSAGYYRTTLGVRFTTYTVSLALEGTYFGGGSPSVTDYPGVTIPSSFSGAAKLGWEW